MVRQAVQQGYPQQSPMAVGPRHQRFLQPTAPLLDVYEWSQRRFYDNWTLADLLSSYDAGCQGEGVPLPAWHHSFGLAFLSKGAFPQARQALQCALDSGAAEAALRFDLGRALLRTQQYAAAAESFQRFLQGAARPELDEALREPLAHLARLQQPRPRALLVAIDEYGLEGVPDLRGAVAGAEALRAVLVERWNFAEPDVQMLTNGAATREAIAAACRELALVARDEVALFYFAGYGSLLASEPAGEGGGQAKTHAG